MRRQVERLAEALERAGDAEGQVEALRGLLDRGSGAREMSPSRLKRSTLKTIGEDLSRRTAVPVDRETAMPLAELIFPDQLPISPPLYEKEFTAALDSLLEEWRHGEALQELGVTPSSSCLIYGPPGTGKTQLALWMGHELELPIVLARLDGLVSSFLGATARNIGVLFGFAAKYRCILLLDEFDAIAKLRDDPQEVGEIKRVVNALLQNLDARKQAGLTIGITNHESLLDPAVWRRFETQLAIPKPGIESRKGILLSNIAPLELSPNTVTLLAWLTEGATGAELEVLARSLKRTQIMAGETQQDLLPTLRRFALLNSVRLEPSRRNLLFAEPKELASRLYSEPALTYTQVELASLFACDQSTISRWLANESSEVVTGQK